LRRVKAGIDAQPVSHAEAHQPRSHYQDHRERRFRGHQNALNAAHCLAAAGAVIPRKGIAQIDGCRRGCLFAKCETANGHKFKACEE